MIKYRVPVLQCQHELLTANYRHPAIIGGVGSGKSRGEVLWADYQHRHPSNRGHLGLMFAQSQKMVKMLLVRPLLEHWDKLGIKYTHNKQESTIFTKYGWIFYDGAENYTRWGNGPNAAWGLFDEAAQVRSIEPWERLLYRVRMRDTTGQTAIGTTPEGFNWVYDMWGEPKPGDGYYRIKARTADNPYLSPEFIPDLLKTIPPKKVAQYLEGEFVVTEGVVFEEYGEENQDDWQYRPGMEVSFAMDFGYNRPSILCIQHDHNGNDHLFAEIRCRNESTHAQAAKMAAIRDEQHWNPGRRTRVYCDPAGAGHQSSSHLTDIAILQQHGFDPKYTTSRHLRAVNAGIEYTQSRFCNGAGQRRLFVNPKGAPDAHRSLQGYRYKEGNKSEPDKDGINDHDCDAIRYYIINRHAPALARGRNVG